MPRPRGEELIPSARRLIKSLRDLGYEFVSAVADLVDNSIAAKATEVDIVLEFDGPNSTVRIHDNGHGMTREELKQALRFGSERDYEQEDLGKFGLGLKTASLSQCRVLTVASRRTREPRISAFSWDLDHVFKTDKWEVLPVAPAELGLEVRYALQKHSGTVVTWRRLDRIVGLRDPQGGWARHRLLTMCRDLEQHLGMVFHRFIAGEVPERKLSLTLNGTPVPAWDPFGRAEAETLTLPPARLALDTGSSKETVWVRPYVLPRADMFSSPDAHALLSGPLKWNRQQGFYIYRSNRMIQSGGWSGLRTADEHTKLARVAIGFPPAADDAFRINVAKMRALLPAELRDRIEDAISPAIKRAMSRYRNKPDVPPKGARVVRRRWTFDQFRTRLLDVCNAREREVVKRVTERLREQGSP